MSFVVRQKSTGQYLQSQESWTTHPEEALRFASGMNLVQYLDKLFPELPQDNLEVEIVSREAGLVLARPSL